MNVESLAAAYHEDGYVVVDGLFDAQSVERLRGEAAALATGQRGAVIGTELLSGGQNEDVLRQVLAIHFPHKASPVMREALFHPGVVSVLNAIVGPDVKAMQSMLFVKNAGKPGQAWHQDEHFIPTRDRSLVGVWIALDDAVVDNGCLWMHPGSHKDGVLYPIKPHGDERFDNSPEAFDYPYEREGGVPVEVKSGGVAFFNGYTLHRSLQNRQSSGFRRALVNHYMSARSLLPWRFGLPPQSREDYRDVVLVSGKDPYAYKGLEEVALPFIRPEDPAQGAELMKLIEARVAAR